MQFAHVSVIDDISLPFSKSTGIILVSRQFMK